MKIWDIAEIVPTAPDEIRGFRNSHRPQGIRVRSVLALSQPSVAVAQSRS